MVPPGVQAVRGEMLLEEPLDHHLRHGPPGQTVRVGVEREWDTGEVAGGDGVISGGQQGLKQPPLVERLQRAGLHAARLGQVAALRQLVDEHGRHPRQQQLVGQRHSGRAGADDEHIGVHGLSSCRVDRVTSNAPSAEPPEPETRPIALVSDAVYPQLGGIRLRRAGSPARTRPADRRPRPVQHHRRGSRRVGSHHRPPVRPVAVGRGGTGARRDRPDRAGRRPVVSAGAMCARRVAHGRRGAGPAPRHVLGEPVSSGGTEITCVVRTESDADSEALLLAKLPRTPRVEGVTAHSVLHAFYGGPDNLVGKLGSLDEESIERLRPPPLPHRRGPLRLDDGDRKLLALLATDGRAGFEQLAAATGWSPTTVRRRMTELRGHGLLYLDIDIDWRMFGVDARTLLWLSVAPAHLEEAGRGAGGASGDRVRRRHDRPDQPVRERGVRGPTGAVPVPDHPGRRAPRHHTPRNRTGDQDRQDGSDFARPAVPQR